MPGIVSHIVISLVYALSLTAPQATPLPAVVLNSFLEGQNFYLDAAEPKILVAGISFGFAPSGTFATKMLVKEGDTTLHDLKFRDNLPERAGVFASVRGRTPGSISLGTGDGPRSLEVFVDEQPAGKFVFTLTKSSNGDPLDPKVSWKIVGPWKDYAHFKHKPDDGSRQDVFFTYWVAQHELAAGEKTVTATLKKGATVVAKSRDNIPNGSRYSRFEVPILKPNNDPLMVKDLPGMAGSYTMEVTAGKRILRSWKVTIGASGFVPHAKSDHTKTGPLEWLSPRVQFGTAVSPFTHFWVGP